MALGLMLLLLWCCCWAVFLSAPAKVSSARKNRAFARTTYLTALSLLFWSAVAWSAPLVAPPSLLWAAFTLVIGGQVLMCAARRSLALSNYDLLFSIAQGHTRAGVYRYLHHPLYIGLLLALAGTSAALLNFFALLTLLFVVLPVLVLRTYIESR